MTRYTEQLDANRPGDSRPAYGAVAHVWSVDLGGTFGKTLVSREMHPTPCHLIADFAVHPPR